MQLYMCLRLLSSLTDGGFHGRLAGALDHAPGCYEMRDFSNSSQSTLAHTHQRLSRLRAHSQHKDS